MSIEVTREVIRFDPVNRAHAVACLAAGDTLFCRETGEGWQLGAPAFWSKRAIRRFIARHYRDSRYWCGENVIHYMVSREIG